MDHRTEGTLQWDRVLVTQIRCYRADTPRFVLVCKRDEATKQSVLQTLGLLSVRGALAHPGWSCLSYVADAKIAVVRSQPGLVIVSDRRVLAVQFAVPVAVDTHVAILDWHPVAKVPDAAIVPEGY